MKPVVNEDKCIACGTCESVCPTGVFEVSDKSKVVAPDECVECGLCESSCPQQAIELVD